MSIIAGIYSLKARVRIPDEYVALIRANLSRDPGRAVSEFGDERTHIFRAELDAFKGAGVYTDDRGGATVVAGEPLNGDHDVYDRDRDRDRDVQHIHRDLAEGKTTTLARCRGTFCAVSAQNGVLSLVADKLGVRQLFYWIGPEFVVFSTALRIIEELPFIPRRMNHRGALEHAALGYPLADRTPYRDVFAMRGGEILQFRGGRTFRCRYWKWDDVAPSETPEADLLVALYRTFRSAVKIRLDGDRSAIGYLSGGLDSRCVVAAICELGAKTHTFNFARPDTQDLILGRHFAAKVKALHTELPKQSGDHIPDYSAKIADGWKVSRFRDQHPAERENVVWSGEGGSVALGHVHLGRRIVELMRAGRTDEAIDTFCATEGIHLSPKLFRSGLFGHPLELVKKGIREEIEEFRSPDPARNFYLFLMLNDQRRKLHGHFENLDRHGVEFQLPFFDAEFFRSVLEIPVDLCLGHRLYVNWLNLFAPAVTEVPWQAYPGHVPCPIPVADGLAYQWDAGYRNGEQRAIYGRLKTEARELLRASDFPSEILSRANLRIAYFIHRTGLRDYSYLIDTARVFHRIRRKCV